ncbi:hypothetical protein FEM48_Zijuj09G0044700 [Ziziphus jujuba var. spinosa]|uniref:PGG domain-containing protein n=1 Tax=Ziziphus jujuba var. spinosa TaxID=714518 RepID=A0A978UQW6_ZIZJJ|nr:hypothetical protein FEM48_Zijuj09G0044700 [Ziziphus jujuba var. spinosa]
MQGSTMQTSLSFELENRKKELFKMAMRGKWKEVVSIYAADSKIHEVKITRSGDTALHVAVSDGQEDVVEQLVEIISRGGLVHAEEVLLTKNERGNTPLHIAASMESVKMCSCIAMVKPSLIGAFNNDRETPFFLTALRGKKEAFLCLHKICEPGQGSSYCRRMDGETILHCAIAGDYFDLAFQIIHLYKELVNSVNERGFTPLHVLASKPSAFKSGSNLGLWNSIIYHCIFVDDLKVEEPSYARESLIKSFKEEKNPNHPENYQSCINFFRLLGNALRIVVYSRDPKKQNKSDAENPEGSNVALNGKKNGKEPTPASEGQHICPSNYSTCIEFVKLIYKSILIVLGLGSNAIMKIREKKEKHKWSVQVMTKLLESTSMYEYEHTGETPQETQKDDGEETKPYEISDGDVQPLTPPNSADSSRSTNTQSTDNQKNSTNRKGGEPERETSEIGNKETAILIAAKNGVTEMVEKILELFPIAIHDMNAEKKNIVLLAVENRQPHVYKLLLKRNILRDSVFRKLDKDGNSALHLAATLGDYKPWLIPGAALQMQWEIKWYEFVKNSMPPHYFVRYNNEKKTPKEIFTETHKKLVKAGGEWLTNTSESCSVVAALIATVAFATSTAVPGGTNKNNGKPTLEHKPAFEVFAIASLVALCFSVTSVVMFLAILTSRYQEMDFESDLPRKLLVGLTSLFVSIASMLVCFCAGHFFVLQDELKYAAFPVYAVACLLVSFFAVAQFPLYFDLLWATYKKVPQRSYKVAPL